MKKLVHLTVFLLLALTTRLQGAEPSSVLLAGKLTNKSGSPVANAEIVVRPKLVAGSPSAITLLSSASGEFSAALLPGVYDLLISDQCSLPLAEEVLVERSRTTIWNRVLEPSNIVICDEIPGIEGVVPLVPVPLPNEIESQ